MKFIKKFFESSTKMEEKFDFLSTHIDEKNILFKEITDNYVFIEYDLNNSEFISLKQYLTGNRFIYDVISFLPEHLYDNINVLIVDQKFYNNNLNILYKNIKWGEHPLLTNLKLRKSDHINDFLFDKFKDTKKAINLPNEVSMIKNLDRYREIEIWDSKTMDDPFRAFETNDNDMIYVQYLLYKVCGS